MEGVIINAVTPFLQDGFIDYQTFERMLFLWERAEVVGIMLGSFVGEGYVVSPAELYKMINLIKKNSSKTVFVNINFIDPRQSLNLLPYLEKADVLLVSVPPLIYMGEDAMRAYVKLILKNCKHRIVLDNNPAKSGSFLDFAVDDGFFEDVRVMGYVDYKQEIIVNGHFQFSGVEGVRQKNGMISAFANFMPHVVCNFFKNPQHDKCGDLIFGLQKVVHKYNFNEVLVIKFLMQKLGLLLNCVREPLLPLPENKDLSLWLQFYQETDLHLYMLLQRYG